MRARVEGWIVAVRTLRWGQRVRSTKGRGERAAGWGCHHELPSWCETNKEHCQSAKDPRDLVVLVTRSAALLTSARTLVLQRERDAPARLVLLRTGRRKHLRQSLGQWCVRKKCTDVGKFKLGHLLFILKYGSASQRRTAVDTGLLSSTLSYWHHVV